MPHRYMLPCESKARQTRKERLLGPCSSAASAGTQAQGKRELSLALPWLVPQNFTPELAPGQPEWPFNRAASMMDYEHEVH
jgi:hypothetical protein